MRIAMARWERWAAPPVALELVLVVYRHEDFCFMTADDIASNRNLATGMYAELA